MKQREEYIPGEREGFDWEEDKAKDDLWELCYVAAASSPWTTASLSTLICFCHVNRTKPIRSFLFFSQKFFYYFCFYFLLLIKKNVKVYN